MRLHKKTAEIDEDTRRAIHAHVVSMLDWAAEQRESQTAGGLDNDLADNGNWQWYLQGRRTAEVHDRACVDDALRNVLGLPGWEEDGAAPPNERRGHLGASGPARSYADGTMP